MLSFMTPNRIRTLLRALFLALFVGPVHPLAAQTIALGQFAHADTERNDPESSKANVDLLLPRLASATPYHFVERAAVDRLIAEQSMSSEGFTRPDSAIRLGRLLRADLLLTGTFFTPSNKPPFVLLEVIETARAEVVAHTEVSVGGILNLGMMEPLTPKDADAVCQACRPLLATAVAEIQARSRQVLIKFLALPDVTEHTDEKRHADATGHVTSIEYTTSRGNPVYDRLGERLEDELSRRAAATQTQKVLRTDRDDAATGEYELRLVGLVEADTAASEQLADYYVWGICETVNGCEVMRLSLWDGKGKSRVLLFPLPSDPVVIDAFVGRVSETIIAETARPTRSSHADATEDGHRAAVARVLNEVAQKTDNRRVAMRLAVATVFLDPATLKNWIYLDTLRWRDLEPEMGRLAEQVDYRLQVRSRFIVDSAGIIQTDALFEGKPVGGVPIKGLSSTGDRLVGEPTEMMAKLSDRIVSDTLIEAERAAEQLAKSAPGQEDAFRRAASSIIADVFPYGIRKSAYEPDPAIATHIIRLLLPRLKVGAALFDAWNETNPTKEWRFDPRDPIADFLCDQDRAEEAKKLFVLDPDELAQSLAALPPETSLAGKSIKLAKEWADQGQPKISEQYQQKYESLRPRAELFLRACSTTPPDTLAAISALLKTPSELLSVPQSLRIGTVDAPDCAAAGDLSALSQVLMPGGSGKDEGVTFVTAIRARQWLVVEYLLQQGCAKRAASWPAHDASGWPIVEGCLRCKDTLGALALAEAAARNRLDLVDRLTANGVRFQTGSEVGPRIVERLVRQRNNAALQKVLAAGALGETASKTFAGQRAPYLGLVIQRRDMDILKMLLAANGNVIDANPDPGSYGYGPVLGEYRSPENVVKSAMSFAATQNWTEGVDAMLSVPGQHVQPVVSGGNRPGAAPSQKSVNPTVDAVQLRANLRAAHPKAKAPELEGIDLLCAIAGNDMAGVAAAWVHPAAREMRANGQPPLIFAIVENRPELVRWLIANGAPVNGLDDAGIAPLAYAAGKGDIELVRMLAARGADVNLHGRRASNPLLHALRAHQEAAAQELITLGASIRPQYDSDDGDPLFMAVTYNYVKLVDRMIANGANPRAEYDGYDILYSAVRSNNPDLIQRFYTLKGGVAHRPNGATPLQTAVIWGAAASVEKLLALGVRDKRAADDAVVRAAAGQEWYLKTDPDWSALHYRPDFWRCLKSFEKYGLVAASRVSGIEDSGASEFLSDFASKSPAEIEAYAKAGGDVINSRAHMDSPLPLQGAANRGDFEQVKVLLALGADPDGKPDEPVQSYVSDPLSAALHQREPLRYELARLLIKHGAHTDGGYLAIALKQVSGPATIRLLLDHGVVIDARAVAEYATLGHAYPESIPPLEAVLTPDELRKLRGSSSPAPGGTPGNS
jgi:ankyrin repeat protein